MLSREEKISTTKLSAVQYVLLLVMVILVARLWKLQVGGNDRYETLAEQNRVRTVPRGRERVGARHVEPAVQVRRDGNRL